MQKQNLLPLTLTNINKKFIIFTIIFIIFYLLFIQIYKLTLNTNLENKLEFTQKQLRIAQVSLLVESTPPKNYGGAERITSYLTEELVRRGHQVFSF